MSGVDEVLTRAVNPDDLERLGRLWQQLSQETLYRRFLAPVHRLSSAMAHRFVEVDHDSREALVAVVDDEIVGIAQYERLPGDPSRADVAVLVQDDWQGVGLGSRLSAEIASLAAAHGVRTLLADVLASNQRMLTILRRNGPALRLHLDSSVYAVELPLREPDEAYPMSSPQPQPAAA